MADNKFKVGYTKLNLTIGILAILIIAAIAVYSFFTAPTIITGIIIIVFDIIIAFSIIPGMAFFKVEVSDSNIKLYNGFGKTSEFTASDIVKIECERTKSVNVGNHKIVKIKTAQDEFSVNDHMKNFNNMLDYLIVRHQSGEIRKKAINADTLESLEIFKNKKS